MAESLAEAAAPSESSAPQRSNGEVAVGVFNSEEHAR